MKKEGVKKIDDFWCEFGFRFHGITMRREESVTIRIIKTFLNEKILPQHFVLSNQIDLCFPKQKLGIEVDGKGHTDRDEKNNKMKQKKK